ncbi:CHAT domain-containing protein [Pleurocapsales cyanobacterium LEGE 10410]|nr:CHAT domain-containing protein [Pleurocapsales cyanobacterium LEGE 10410]
MARRSFRWLSVLFTIALAISLFIGQISTVNAKVSNEDLVQQGVTEYRQGKYRAAIALWHRALNSYQATPDNPNTVVVLENLARVHQQIGQSEQAITYWDRVTDRYRELGNEEQLGRSLSELAQAYSSLGQHRQAIALLCGEQGNKQTECFSTSAIALAKKNADSLGEVAAKGSLGEAYRLRGNYARAVDYLKDSLTTARILDNPQLEISVLNSLGNTYSSLAQISYRQADSAETRGEIYGRTGLEYAPDSPVMQLRQDGKQQDRIALGYFQDSLAIATQQQNSLERVRSLISSLPIYYRLSDTTAAANAKQQALDLVSTLPLEATTVYATIDLAKLLQPEKVSFSSCYSADILSQARALLQQGVDTARQIDNSRATSFALGEFGHTYECSGDYQQALKLTKQARLAAEQHKDSLYLWEWQTGRILLAQKNSDRAIAAYETAISTLESIRDDLLTANRDVQFDFRDTVEPIYRGLIARRLGMVDNVSVVPPTETRQVSNVSSILTTVDSLRLAELQNYFGNDCAISDVVATDKVDLLAPAPNTAYFSTIILDDRTAVIANFPGRKTKIVWDSDRGKAAIAEEINQYRRGLENFYTKFDVSLGQNIYSWLVQPFAEDLEREQITTLVFIQDGLLRSVPMSALHDGEQFLVQKYAIATTPSLNLTSPNTANRQELKALALGLSEPSQVDNKSFPPLPNVKAEIKQVQNIFAESTGVLNNSFTRDRLAAELAETSYPIVHIATHGQFSSEPEDTFLVTGNNEKLTITELDRIIRSTATQNEPVDLIALTACQTAVGDERAALGLAGIAIQAGANSALASLWSINDEVTPAVMQDFYLGWRDRRLSKAQALQQAQIASIERGVPPALWSPFVLIGNWQ